VKDIHSKKIDKADWPLYEQMCRKKHQTEMIRNATDLILQFNETVISIAYETIPKTSTNPKHPGKPWFNDDCKDAIKREKKGRMTVQKASYIGLPRQFPHLQGESSKNIETKPTHFLA
jgi:hypothetical protein